MARQRNVSSEPELRGVEDTTTETAARVAVNESMYIGPTIPGVIHQNAIYVFDKAQLSTSEEDLMAALSNFDEKGRVDHVTSYVALQMAVAKYPEIAELVVPVDGIMNGLHDIKTRGTDLYVAYRKIVKASTRR